MTKFKKQFGQNFLKHDRFANKLIEPLQLSTDDLVIEVGPGDGRVTNLLLQNQAQVVSVEIDYSLIPRLIQRFGKLDHFELLHQSILDLDIPMLLEKYGKQSYKLCGSLPYNISKQIIRKFLEDPRPEIMSFIVQAEVAKVYVAQTPKATLLGNLTQSQSAVKKLVSIPNTQFVPAPKVDGAILTITPYSEEVDKEMLHVMKIGFKSPRKTLWNNLTATWKQHRDELSDIWKDLEIGDKTRPAELSMQKWKQLADALKSASIISSK